MADSWRAVLISKGFSHEQTRTVTNRFSTNSFEIGVLTAFFRVISCLFVAKKK